MKNICLLLFFFVFSFYDSFAATEVNGFYYSLNSSAKTCTLTYETTSSGSVIAVYKGDVVVPETVEYDGVTYTVTGISGLCFRNCAELTSVIIPSTVIAVGNDAFYGCSSLRRVVFCDSQSTIQLGVYMYGRGNSSYYTSMFIGTPLESLYIGRNFETTNTSSKYLFTGCSNLKHVEIGGYCTSLPKRSFYQCGSLKEFEGGSRLESIGEEALCDCTSLTSITIPDAVTAIGASAFSGCSNLESVVCSNSVTTIGQSAFMNCKRLTLYDMPNSVTTIGSNTFKGCSNLTTIVIPDAVTSIGEYAFSGCSGMTSITIGSTVREIGAYAFSQCTNVKEIHSLNVAPPLCQTTSFNGMNLNQALVYVPKDSKSFYSKATVWKNFICIIEDSESAVERELKLQIEVLEKENSKLKARIENFERGDVNENGEVNISDVSTLVDILLKR